jgi:hypothetical protein
MLEATLPIKGLQVRLEIDVKPLDTAFLRHCCGVLDQSPTNTTSAYGGVNGCVQDERMNSAIPGKIDKSNQTILVIRAYIG